MSNIDLLPLPSIVMNEELTILQSSEEAFQLFGRSENFLEWVDHESKEKAKKFLLSKTHTKLELNMRTIMNTVSLFTLRIKWTDDKATILFIEQDMLLLELMKKVNDHKRRLEESDMELILKNNELTESFMRIQELSTAVIHLSPSIILIPVFGDLDGTLLKQSMDRILEHVSTNNIDEVIIDLQSVGSIEVIGIDYLKKLIENCSLMGAKPYITGVKPEHAKRLNDYQLLGHATFINTLNHTISKLV